MAVEEHRQPQPQDGDLRGNAVGEDYVLDAPSQDHVQREVHHADGGEQGSSFPEEGARQPVSDDYDPFGEQPVAARLSEAMVHGMVRREYRNLVALAKEGEGCIHHEHLGAS